MLSSSVARLSMALSILATLCQGLATFLPGWTIYDPVDIPFIQHLVEHIQTSVWFVCMEGWQNCPHYFYYKHFDNDPGSDIIPPAVLMATQTPALLLLIASTVICTKIVHSKTRTDLVTIHLGLNVASCCLIMCGVLTTVSYNGEFKIVNHLSSLNRNFVNNPRYGHSFILAIVAAALSLASGIISCCMNNNTVM